MKKNFLFALLAMNLAFMPLPSQAAEKVIVKYSVLSETVSIPELSQLSRTGEASPAIAAYLKLANKTPEDLRGWLNQSVNINAANLSDILNGFLGKLILDQVVQVIYTP
ncbi:MAG: alpha/beta hydrolase, partial [Microcystaceae cyanobacterium]